MATPELVRDILPNVEGVDRRAIPRDHSIPPQLEIEFFIAQANQFRRSYEDAAREYRTLAHRESELEALRPIVLAEIKARIMEQLPSVAATNADKMAHIDADYTAHLALQRDTVRQKDDARTRMESARFGCQTAIAAVKATAGLV